MFRASTASDIIRALARVIGPVKFGPRIVASFVGISYVLLTSFLPSPDCPLMLVHATLQGFSGVPNVVHVTSFAIRPAHYI